jgi:hypothetical protein
MKTFSEIFSKGLYKIDLTKPLIQLEFICKEYGFPLDTILEYKYSGCREIALKDDGEFYVFSYKKGNDVYWFDILVDKNGKFSISDEIEFSELPIILETDVILDKISKYGLNSLHMTEFDYLYSLK